MNWPRPNTRETGEMTMRTLNEMRHLLRCMEYYDQMKDQETGECKGLLFNGKPIWDNIIDPSSGPGFDANPNSYSISHTAPPAPYHWFVTSVGHYHRGKDLECVLRQQRLSDQADSRVRMPVYDLWQVPGEDFGYAIEDYRPMRQGAKLIKSVRYDEVQDPKHFATDEEIEDAREKYAYDSDNDVEVDEGALASRAEGEGLWVQAQVWLARPE